MSCANGTTCINPGSIGTSRSGWCDDCLDAAARDVRALALDYRDLAQSLPRSSSSALTQRVAGTADASTPLALHVDELQRMIHWTLTTWEPAVREAAGLGPERIHNVRLGWAVTTAVTIIAPRVDILAELPLTCCFADGLEAGPVERTGAYGLWSLRSLHARSSTVLGLTRLVHTLPGECSRCGMPTLRRDDGSDAVRCDNCGCRWTAEDYRRYVGLELAGFGAAA